MAIILSIETATNVCSTSIIRDNEVVISKHDHLPNTHAKNLMLFIQKIIDESNISLNDLDAVAVSEGPGSYTGLRIGFSSAKGFCYALDIPLITVSTLKGIAFSAKQQFIKTGNIEDYKLIPMIDAGRMEVYTAVYNQNLITETEPHPLILNENSFENINNKTLVFAGNGCNKFSKIVSKSNYVFFDDISCNAETIGLIAQEKYRLKQFADTAYSEPFYLKQFEAKKSVVKGLH
ncbi:MAG: tRNA (adenosine(37)-N6)-threonylcarbamoyltransferase complex dimerization subunit type 1 TsaB [Lentimicrobiaceae bacterium]|nr:tRNA (adenosine(37)-N6)-threonylcarbamoyltransferase complex dimerization subunit type 1 TsaB [Lentimicrobiaceae bacterium]